MLFAAVIDIPVDVVVPNHVRAPMHGEANMPVENPISGFIIICKMKTRHNVPISD
jgi:hypothetical protein